MVKKLIILIILLILLFYGFKKYDDRQKRLDYLKQVQNAKAPQQKITLLEGWDNKDIAEYLEKNKITPPGEFLKAQINFNYSAYKILSDKPKNIDLEGFIFPDTYFIPSTVPTGTLLSDIILKKTLDNFAQKVTPEIVLAGQKNGLDLAQLLTLASIIEKESGRNFEEQKIISGIFYNRLKINMALQSDATVNYVTGKSQTQATYDDLKIDSPYNTYKYAGLPPGPICNPGLNAIIAAANPTKNDYLYFLSDPESGKAVYAKTLDEHNANRQKYLK